MVPGLHFNLGPFGPFVGRLVVGNLAGGRILSSLLSIATMATGMALIAAAFTGLLFGEDPSNGLAKAAPLIVFVYTGVFSTVGAVVGALVSAPAAKRS
jgi:hypothetical protein